MYDFMDFVDFNFRGARGGFKFILEVFEEIDIIFIKIVFNFIRVGIIVIFYV